MQNNNDWKQNINKAVSLLQEIGSHAANLGIENIKEPECEYQKRVLNDAVERIRNGAVGLKRDIDISKALVVHEESSTLKRRRENLDQGNISDSNKRANASTGTGIENDLNNRHRKRKDESGDRMDPMNALGGCARIWAEIVSFCAEHGIQHDGIWIKDAVHIHTTLSLVCKSWMSTFNDPMYIGHINANLNALKTKRVIPSIQWMCRHGSRLSSLTFGVRYDHIPIVEKLLQETNTNNLRNISMCYAEYGLPWMDHAYDLKLGLNPDVVSLCTTKANPSLEEKANALDLPFASEVSNNELGMRLQKSIASHCPHLESLDWNRGSAHRQEAIDTPLLALQSLTTLKLAIKFSHRQGYESDDLYLITNMIQNLCNLEKLELSFNIDYGGSVDKKLRIHSKSLRHLDVTGLGKLNFVACKCPLLEKFVCNGDYFSNGSMPILSQAEIEEYNKKYYRGKTLVQCQGKLQLPDMDIPDECECTFINFDPSLGVQKWFIESGTPIE